MRKNKKKKGNSSPEIYPNLRAKELDRDIVNLYLEEPDLIMDSPEERLAYLKKNYSAETLASLGIK